MSKRKICSSTDNKQSYSIKQSAGFTLVELLIVIVILGILATVLVVGISSIMCTSKEGATSTLMKNIGMALDQYKVYKNRYPKTIQVDPDKFSSKVLVDELKSKGPNNEAYFVFKDQDLFNGGIASKVFPDKIIKYRNNNESPFNKESPDYVPADPTKEPNVFNKYRFDMWTSGCGESDIDGQGVHNW